MCLIVVELRIIGHADVDVLVMRIAAGVRSPLPRDRPCIARKYLLVADDILDALVGMRAQILGELVAVEAAARIVRDVLRLDYARAVGVVIALARSMRSIADPTVVVLVAHRRKVIDLLEQRSPSPSPGVPSILKER